MTSSTTNYGEAIGTVTLKVAIDRFETFRVYQSDGSYFYNLGSAARTSDGFVQLEAVELRRSEKTNSRHEYSWFITPSTDHMPVFSAPQAGDSGLQACLTWLANKGYKQISDSFPDSEIYVR